MAVDKSQERRQQLALVLRRRGADLGADAFGLAAIELNRALELLMLPTGGALALAPNSHVGSAAALANGVLFGDEGTIETRPRARNDLDDFHDFPLPRRAAGEIYNVRMG